MTKVTRKLLLGLLTLVLTLGVFAVAPSPAGAWNASTDTDYTYYAPGPPPGSYLTACVVTTRYSDSGDYGRITAYDNASSDCYWACVQVTTWVPGQGNTLGSYVCGPASNNARTSFGHPNSAWVVHTNYQAWNQYGGYWAWTVT
jgi:hypothetical protein